MTVNKLQKVLPEGKTILFAILNWGIGHASRSLPIIKIAQSKNNKIIIASDGLSLDFLKKELPDAKYYKLPSYNITYRYQSIFYNLLIQSPRIFSTYIKEGKAITKIVSDESIDLIISDNRFNAFHPSVKNIYISHQLCILHQNPIIAYLANSIHHLIMSKYDEIWVPDDENHILSGQLSRSSIIKAKFIGPLTRLNLKANTIKDIDLLLLLSGPEPQRTWLEESLIKAVPLKKLKTILIRGTNTKGLSSTQDLEIVDLADTQTLESLLPRAKTIICRSGYSTIMDIASLNARIIYIPTPGQTEQEYLAHFHQNEKKQHFVINQGQISSHLPSLLLKMTI
jgi:uncharacterized protein (TIGR00661 family)